MATKGRPRHDAPPYYADGSAVTPSDAADLPDGPCAALVVLGAGNVTLTPVGGPVSYAAAAGDVVFAAAGKTATRDNGSWLADGFRDGDVVNIGGTVSNNGAKLVASVAATVLTFDAGEAITDETIAAATMTATGHPVLGLVANEPLEINATRVWAKATTATGIVALY